MEGDWIGRREWGSVDGGECIVEDNMGGSGASGARGGGCAVVVTVVCAVNDWRSCEARGVSGREESCSRSIFEGKGVIIL